MTDKEKEPLYYTFLKEVNARAILRNRKTDSFMWAAYKLELTEAQINELQKIYKKHFGKEYVC